MERYTSSRLGIGSILKWQLTRRFRKSRLCRSPSMEVMYHSSLPEHDSLIWLGHASVAMRLDGSTILIDPVLKNIPFYPRHTPLPLEADNIKADIILITHAHYDHFDKPSIKYLLKLNPNATIVAPSGFWRYLKKDIAREKCFELEWWESLMVRGLFITFVPSLHWSKRTPFDTNKALWGGFVIQNENHTLYHAGDTAYGSHFAEIAERFEIDEALLPIGAYRPEIIMKNNHLNPEEAFQACRDLQAKTLIPIHYGTFCLSDEPMDEPLEWFNRLSLHPQYFKPTALKIGEVFFLEGSSQKSG